MAESFDLYKLPKQVRDMLNDLDLELGEEEITQKGYDKKKKMILEPYLNLTSSAIPPAEHSNLQGALELSRTTETLIDNSLNTESFRSHSPIDHEYISNFEIPEENETTFQNEFTISIHKGAVKAAILAQNFDAAGPVSSKRALGHK